MKPGDLMELAPEERAGETDSDRTARVRPGGVAEAIPDPGQHFQPPVGQPQGGPPPVPAPLPERDHERRLLDGHLEEWEFEAEAGQLDGTFAHAIERVISLCARDAGYVVRTAAAVCGEAGAGGDSPYPYAEPSHS